MHWGARFLVSLFLLCSTGVADVSKTIDGIPEKDREKIKFLFTFFVQRDTLGFVLFGESKCLTFSGIPLTHKNYILPYKLDHPLRFQKDLKDSWLAWKRYESHFKHPNVLVCEEYQSVENEMYLQLFILDKRKLSAVLDHYREDFVEVLGKSFTPEKFIGKLERKKRLRPLIKHDEKLLGILLGFGRESSTAFRNLGNGIEPNPPLDFVGKRPTGCQITPVSFRGYANSPEVQTLLESYRKEILEIENIFKGDSFLSDTLEKFCSS